MTIISNTLQYGFGSAVMWCSVIRCVVSDISKDCSAFTAGATHLMMQHRVPENLRPQLHGYNILRSHFLCTAYLTE